MLNWIIIESLLLLLGFAATAACGAFCGLAVRRLLPARAGAFRRAAPYLLFALSARLPSWIGDENTLILVPFFIWIFLTCYKAPLLARLVTCCVFYLLLVPFNMVLDTVDWWDAGVWAAWSKAAFAGLVWLLTRRLTQEGKPLELSRYLWGVCGMLALAPLFATLSFAIWNGFLHGNIDAAQLRLAYTILPFVVLSAAALLIALTVLSRHEELERAAQLAGMRELYYQSLKHQEQQIHTLRHDLRNHLAVTEGLLENGDLARAKSYLRELSASPALRGVRRICGNETANVVLSCKMERMEELGVLADFSVALPPELPVADVDLCALLGNALDNAMEAAAQAEDKTVALRLRADRGMLMLRVQNSFREEPQKQNNAFSTTKQDRAAHGFGIPAMRAIAEQYCGTMDAQVRDGRFDLTICIPLGQRKSGGK